MKRLIKISEILVNDLLNFLELNGNLDYILDVNENILSFITEKESEFTIYGLAYPRKYKLSSDEKLEFAFLTDDSENELIQDNKDSVYSIVKAGGKVEIKPLF